MRPGVRIRIFAARFRPIALQRTTEGSAVAIVFKHLEMRPSESRQRHVGSSRGLTQFDVFDQDGQLVGTSLSEIQAIWSAVTAAEELSKSGVTVRVVTARASGDVEQFVARPRA